MSGTTHLVTKYHIPEDLDTQQHHSEDLISHKSATGC